MAQRPGFSPTEAMHAATRRALSEKANLLSMGPVSIEKSTLQDQIYEELRLALMRGSFSPGDTLTIRSLAEVMGTSIVPVRDALQRLVAERALEILPNRSACVPVISLRDFNELIDIRLALEGQAVELSAGDITPQDIAKLKALNTDFARAIGGRDTDLILQTNMDLHFAMYRICGRELLFGLIKGLWVRVGPLLRSPFRLMERTPELYSPSIKNHEEIIAAMSDKDAASARAALVHDIDAAADWYRRNHVFVTVA